MEKSKVYFTKEITPESVVKMYEALGISLPGKVAIKLHSGEKGNQNYIRPEFVRPIVEKLNATVVECNAAYGGARNTTEKHKKLIEEHHWTKYFDVDIMDEEGPDVELDIPNGKVLKKDFVGKHINNYDSMLVLSHFEGVSASGSCISSRVNLIHIIRSLEVCFAFRTLHHLQDRDSFLQVSRV